MKRFVKLAAGAAIVLAGISSTHAATVVCGDSSLGIRTTTVDPALTGSCYAGLQNLGNGDLEALIDSEYGTTNAGIIDRDNVDSNGGGLDITGVGGGSGTWSFSSTLWDTYSRLFLYFHFGDGPDNPSGTSTTDPDIFIVELVSPDFMGTWEHFDGTDDGRQRYGLSNIALIGEGDDDDDDDDTDMPEPGSLALLGLGLLGLGLSRRRKI